MIGVAHPSLQPQETIVLLDYSTPLLVWNRLRAEFWRFHIDFEWFLNNLNHHIFVDSPNPSILKFKVLIIILQSHLRLRVNIWKLHFG